MRFSQFLVILFFAHAACRAICYVINVAILAIRTGIFFYLLRFTTCGDVGRRLPRTNA